MSSSATSQGAPERPAPFSQDAHTRGLEMQFVSRVLSVGFEDSAAALSSAAARTGADPEVEAAEQLAAFRNPVFARIAAEMARRVPHDRSFGKFGAASGARDQATGPVAADRAEQAARTQPAVARDMAVDQRSDQAGRLAADEARSDAASDPKSARG